jgi:hypothetical protein
MRKYFCDIYEATQHGLKLPSGLTHLMKTFGRTSDELDLGFPSLAAAQAFRKVWLDPKAHEKRTPPSGHQYVTPDYRSHGGLELKIGEGEGEFALLYPEEAKAAT